jgi:two-component system cell cycle sensor histidine kinase/response regulator CckA
MEDQDKTREQLIGELVELRQRVVEQEALREAMLALTTTLDRDEVIDRILAQLQQVVPYDTSSVQLLRGGRLEIVGGRGFPNLEELLGVAFDPKREDNPNREVFRTHASLIVDDAPTVYEEFLRGPHAPAGIRSWLGVPMLVGKRFIGMIALDKSDPRFYTQEHARLAEAFAAQAAVAIENARLYQQAQQEISERRRAEEELRESEERYRTLVEQSLQGLAIIGREGIVFANSVAAEIIGYPVEELMLFSAKDVRALIHPDDRTFVWGRFRDRLSGEPVPRRYEFRMIRKDGTVCWVEMFSSRIEYGGVPAVQATLVDISGRKQADQALRRRNRELRMLNRASQVINSTLDLDQVLIIVLEEVRHLLGVVASSIWLVDPETDEVVCQQAAGPHSEIVRGWRLAPGEGIAGWVARHGESLILPDMQADERHFLGVDQRIGLSLRSMLSVPLRVKQGVIGALQVLDAEVGRFGMEDLTLLELLTSSAAIGIENARLFERTRQEINERKQAEQALQESEARARQRQMYLEMVLAAAPDAIVTMDASHRVIEWNPGAERLFGYSRQEVIGRDLDRLIANPGVLEEAIGFTLMSLKGKDTGPVEVTRYRKDGSPVDVILAGSPILEGEESAGTVAVYTDNTERKRVEKERAQFLAQIQEQAQRVQQIVDTVPEGVLLLNADRQVTLANPLGEENLVTLADARVGDTLTHIGDRSLAELLTSPPEGLWHEVAADGRSFQAIARPIEVGPTPGGWVMVIRDVTQQREVEQRIQQQERLASVGQLAAGIAHDFNNIMATIVLYAQMTAMMEELPAVVRERMQTINQQAGHATRLIQQMLDFSRRAVLERRPLDLTVLLTEHVKLLERTLPESIEVRLVCQPDERAAPLIVNVDPTRIQQMVTNLALNARDAMPGGGELLAALERIQIHPGESPPLPDMGAGEWVRLTVSDTGTGIAPDVLPHVFEPFFTTKEGGRGSGLGLAQVYGIVAQHEGRIDVQTQVGKGTAFTIYLPIHSSESPIDASAIELPALVTGGGETILVVEDDANVRRALVESLELLGYQVMQAANGQEALAALERRDAEVDLLLSDVVMPGMGGKALLHAMRERGSTVPVVLLTGHPLEKEMEELRAKGMADWLPKPPALEQLAEVVARALGAGTG